ncbi:MAG: hypothetical protein LUJ09_05920 [Firmicutes bacterium]|nr:hypothetical protein [Bacillota bacterium]
MGKDYFYLIWGDGYCSSMDDLTRPQEDRFIQARFIDYIRDEAGNPIGVKLSYDAGHDCFFDYGDTRIELYPNQEVNLVYWYSQDTEDGDWFDSFEYYEVELVTAEELHRRNEARKKRNY